MGLRQLEVKLSNEHLNKFSKTKPLKALAELIWNALDADATEVEVKFDKNGLGGIEHIYIVDNGDGINFGYINDRFGKLGGSHKINARFSPGGRRYHGKLGQGRYNGFALGKSVEWVCIFREDEELYEYNIIGRLGNMNYFQFSEPKKIIGIRTGVSVSITELFDEKVNELADSERLASELTVIFAPYLLAYSGIKIIIDGRKLDPNKVIASQQNYIINVNYHNGEIKGLLKVIEWKTGSNKKLFLCNNEGITYEEESSGVKSTGGFSHTAYLHSDVIEKLVNENQLEVREMSLEYNALRDEAYEILKSVYRSRLANEASKEVKKLKEEKVYPYSGKATSVIEIAERQVFDICAVKINQYLPEFSNLNKGSKKFTYRLLKEALQANPTSLSKILNEVLNLPIDQQEEFAAILDKTSLESIINTTKLISDRVSFINGLEQILYTDEYHKRLKERSQLHKILLGELWLFGEQYTYAYDDISLKNALKKHLQLLGRSDLSEEIDYTNIKDLNDIPDIGLYRQCVTGSGDHFENLVIELKRPSCTISQDELNQIEKYAVAIEENEYFDKDKTKWKIILLGIKMDKFAAKKVTQSDREPGLLYRGDNMEVWVKEWKQVIQEAKGKHRYLQDKLELFVKDNEEGMRYLKEKYSQYLPE
ncbi:ATP-binding protein [Paenibacillus sp. 32352]|uniref:ATP-binding protein n=1 Tax=Paenibacillus sp. 32352 TaxID=1969111 RepID=UPI0015C45237|nr:ATP-binding protein [Paenibacillus sp. 32352]